MITMLAEAAGVGELVVTGGSAAVIASIATLLVKRGFSVHVGEESVNQEPSSREPKKCPLHDGLVSDVTEIKSDVKKVMFHLMGENKD
jgi:hypothetical protein